MDNGFEVFNSYLVVAVYVLIQITIKLIKPATVPVNV